MIKGLALGYFDLFHIGHLRYIKKSKSMCEYLIVGVAPDSFALNSKGYSTIIPEVERLEIISSIKYVDEVLIVAHPISDTIKVAEWIDSLDIDIIFCGAEWRGS